MNNTFKNCKDLSLSYTTIDHIKPIKIIVFDNRKKEVPIKKDEDLEFEKKYNWFVHWLFKK